MVIQLSLPPLFIALQDLKDLVSYECISSQVSLNIACRTRSTLAVFTCPFAGHPQPWLVWTHGTCTAFQPRRVKGKGNAPLHAHVVASLTATLGAHAPVCIRFRLSQRYYRQGSGHWLQAPDIDGCSSSERAVTKFSSRSFISH